MKYYVTTIYFHCDDVTDAVQAGALAAERLEQFAPDLKISDEHTEEVFSEISEKTKGKTP